MTRPERVAAWLAGRQAVWLATAWGFAEATVFFVVPDVLLTVSALFSPRASARQLWAVLAGSLIGGALMFGMASRDPGAARHLVERVPFVAPSMFQRVETDFDSSGAGGMTRGPLSGIPYKVYAVVAPSRTSLARFLLVSVPARLERLLVTWVLFAAVGVALRRRVVGRPDLALAGHAAYWAVIYAVYWAAV